MSDLDAELHLAICLGGCDLPAQSFGSVVARHEWTVTHHADTGHAVSLLTAATVPAQLLPGGRTVCIELPDLDPALLRLLTGLPDLTDDGDALTGPSPLLPAPSPAESGIYLPGQGPGYAEQAVVR